jgi:hypothetical protein
MFICVCIMINLRATVSKLRTHLNAAVKRELQAVAAIMWMIVCMEARPSSHARVVTLSYLQGTYVCMYVCM